MESNKLSEKKKNELTVIYESLNPAELKRKIEKKLSNLQKAYDKKKGRFSVGNLHIIKNDFGVISNHHTERVSVS